MTDADRAEVERIKDRLRACDDRAALDTVRDEERAALIALEGRHDCAVLGIQIRNLLTWMVKVEMPARDLGLQDQAERGSA